MKLRKYFVYLDDGTERPLKLAIPAKSEKYAREYVSGNGEVVAIKDVTEEYPISLDKVYDALNKAGFGRIEMDFICRALVSTGITN